MMKKILIALIAIAMTLGGTTSARAAGPAFTLDPTGVTLPIAAAAADWSKNTGITVGVGACSGPGCVHFAQVGLACGRNYPVGGCAYLLTDGSCQVEVALSVTDSSSEWIRDLVTKHEVGHCLWRFLGVPVGFHLPESPHALMSATQPSYPSKKDATLTSIDRRYTKDLVG